MRRLASASFALMAILACGSKDLALHPALQISATPLPPTPGQPVSFDLETTDIGTVEIYQGDELVSRVVNPTQDAPPGFYRFIAKSDAVPRAVGYGLNGAKLDATAKLASGPAPGPVDAGKDAKGPPPVMHLTEKCPVASPHTSDPDAGPMDVCGGPGGLLVMLRVENLASYPVDVYRTAQPPNQCSFEGRLRIYPNTIESTTLFDRNIVRFIDGESGGLLREYEMTTGGSCDLVFQP